MKLSKPLLLALALMSAILVGACGDTSLSPTAPVSPIEANARLSPVAFDICPNNVLADVETIPRCTQQASQ